jgi:SIR2-like domain
MYCQKVGMPMTNADAEGKLLELLSKQSMLLFAGAGLSIDAGYPLWGRYLEELERELGAEAPSADDALERADWIRRAFRDKGRDHDYLAHLQRTFGPNPAMPYSPLQRAFVQFGFRGAITTNYDPTLVNALSIQNIAAGRSVCTALDLGDSRAYGVFDFLRLAARGPTTESVLHLHGVYNNPDRIVLTASDYHERYGDFETVGNDHLPVNRALGNIPRKVIWTLLVTYSTLFVGFSLDDPALRHILDVTSADFQRGRYLDHFAIVGAESDDEERKYTDAWRAHGITPIFYRVVSSSGLGRDHSNLKTLVARLADKLNLDHGLDPIGAFTDRMLDL